jgi:hypothetical protein
MEGYYKIARLMGEHHELEIFRRFATLNMQNLLHLQGELTQLELELHDLAKRDETHPDRKFHSKDWRSLARTPGDGNELQWQKALQVREKLKEYSAIKFSFSSNFVYFSICL